MPGALSEGATREEALENIREVICLWVEAAEERREHLPTETLEKIVQGVATTLAHQEDLGWGTSMEAAIVDLGEIRTVFLLSEDALAQWEANTSRRTEICRDCKD